MKIPKYKGHKLFDTQNIISAFCAYTRENANYKNWVVNMKSIYAIWVKGSMFYVAGNISSEECLKLESLAKNFKSSSTDSQEICKSFIESASSFFGINLTPLVLQNIFRIK